MILQVIEKSKTVTSSDPDFSLDLEIRLDGKLIDRVIISDYRRFLPSDLTKWYFDVFIYEKRDHPDAQIANNELREKGVCFSRELFRKVNNTFSFREVVIIGVSYQFHALNWEGLLLIDGMGLYTHDIPITRRVARSTGDVDSVKVDDLGTSVVISGRPKRVDIPYTMIQKTFFDSYSRHGGIVDIVRPGTLDALSSKLKSLNEVDILHIDTHGMWLTYPRYEEAQKKAGRKGGRRFSGHKFFLAFESDHNDNSAHAHYVGIEELGDVLKGTKVKLLAFSSCHSADASTDHSICSYFSSLGIPTVIGFSHAVRFNLVDKFYASFYESFFAGFSVQKSALHGRNSAAREHINTGYYNAWQLPVVYQNHQHISFDLSKEIPAKKENQADFLTIYSDVIRKLEKAVFHYKGNTLVLGLHGSGKTTLAKKLESWWNATSTAFRATYYEDSLNVGLAPTCGHIAIIDNVTKEDIAHWERQSCEGPLVLFTNDHTYQRSDLDSWHEIDMSEGAIGRVTSLIGVYSQHQPSEVQYELLNLSPLARKRLELASQGIPNALFPMLEQLVHSTSSDEAIGNSSYELNYSITRMKSLASDYVATFFAGLSQNQQRFLLLLAPYENSFSLAYYKGILKPPIKWKSPLFHASFDKGMSELFLKSLELAQKHGLIGEQVVHTSEVDDFTGDIDVRNELYRIHPLLTSFLRSELSKEPERIKESVEFAFCSNLVDGGSLFWQKGKWSAQSELADVIFSGSINNYLNLVHEFCSDQDSGLRISQYLLIQLDAIGRRLHLENEVILAMEKVFEFADLSSNPENYKEGDKDEIRSCIEDSNLLLFFSLCSLARLQKGNQRDELIPYLLFAIKNIELPEKHNNLTSHLWELTGRLLIKSQRVKKGLICLSEAYEIASPGIKKDQIGNLIQFYKKTRFKVGHVVFSRKIQDDDLSLEPTELDKEAVEIQSLVMNSNYARDFDLQKRIKVLLNKSASIHNKFAYTVGAIAYGWNELKAQEYLVAEQWLKKALNLSRRESDLELEVVSYYGLSALYFKKYEFGLAHHYAQFGIDLIERAPEYYREHSGQYYYGWLRSFKRLISIVSFFHRVVFLRPFTKRFIKKMP